jgi:hypothetical protein
MNELIKYKKNRTIKSYIRCAGYKCKNSSIVPRKSYYYEVKYTNYVNLINAPRYSDEHVLCENCMSEYLFGAQEELNQLTQELKDKGFYNNLVMKTILD